jgi:hypothetical protein
MVIVTGRKCIYLAVESVTLKLKLNLVFDGLDNLFSIIIFKLNSAFYFIVHKYYFFNNAHVINQSQTRVFREIRWLLKIL